MSFILEPQIAVFAGLTRQFRTARRMIFMRRRDIQSCIKAWFGGLTSSVLDGYRVGNKWGYACFEHCFPLCCFDVPILAKLTDKLRSEDVRHTPF